MQRAITFNEAVQILENMLDTTIAETIIVEYEVIWGGGQTKMFTSQIESVSDGVVCGYPGREIKNVTPFKITDSKYFIRDYGTRIEDGRLATHFYTAS